MQGRNEQRRSTAELKANHNQHDYAESRVGRPGVDLQTIVSGTVRANVEDMHPDDQNILVNERQGRQAMEARVLQSVPLRQPSGSASPALSGRDSRSRSRSRASTPAHSASLQNAFQGKELRNVFHTNTNSARDGAPEPIAELDSAREISSINVRPPNQVTVTHDDS